MKKLVLVAVAFAFVFLFAAVGTAMAVKPAGLGGAQTYAWHLSGAIMPVPPYGSRDVLGSDTASKLIVNQPNGNTEVTITGVMNGLNPNTTYTVYLSKLYSPYTGWPGFFTSTVPAFTFTTGSDGSGSWHLNLTDANFAGSSTYTLSVWINGGGYTILISDNFQVTVSY